MGVKLGSKDDDSFFWKTHWCALLVADAGQQKPFLRGWDSHFVRVLQTQLYNTSIILSKFLRDLWEFLLELVSKLFPQSCGAKFDHSKDKYLQFVEMKYF